MSTYLAKAMLSPLYWEVGAEGTTVTASDRFSGENGWAKLSEVTSPRG